MPTAIAPEAAASAPVKTTSDKPPAAKPSKPKRPSPAPASSGPGTKKPASAKPPADPKKERSEGSNAKPERARRDSKGLSKDVKISAKPVKNDNKGTSKDHKPVAKDVKNGKVESDDVEPVKAPIYLPKTPVTIPILNTLEMEACALLLGNLLEFSPSIGYALANMRPFKTTQHVVDTLNGILDSLPSSYIQSFLKRFSELALIPKAKLSKEHKCCVGLEKISDTKREELTTLYSQYRQKFGFPFVVCARETKAEELPAMIGSQLLNDLEQEVQSRVPELKKIARMRLLELVVA